MAANILNPIPAEHLLLFSYATTSVLSENRETIVWGDCRENTENPTRAAISSIYAMGRRCSGISNFALF